MHVPLPDLVPSHSAPDLSRELTDAPVISTSAGPFTIKRLVLTEGPGQGTEMLVVQSDRVRAAICPTRGMSLWKAHIDGQTFGWNSPVQGPIHPSHVALSESSGLGWLDGFDELLVRCGLRSFGAPDFDERGQLLFPLHGRVGNTPAGNLKVHVDEEHSLLEVEGKVCETRFLQYNLQLDAKYVFAYGQPTIEVHDRVQNASATKAEMQLLYHINVGRPLLDGGAQLHVSSDRIVARDKRAAEDLSTWQSYLPPTPGYSEQVYFSKGIADSEGWAHAVLTSPDASSGFAVCYRPESLPYFSQWKNTVAEADGYVTGLEPATGFPNPRSFEQKKGRLVTLEPYGSMEFRLRLEGLADAASVKARTDALNRLKKQPMEALAFDPEWCLPHG